MTFKILLFIHFLILSQIYRLFKEGIMEHKFEFGILKLLILNTIFISILSAISFYLGILIKIKEAIPPIIKKAAKAFATPLKNTKKDT